MLSPFRTSGSVSYHCICTLAILLARGKLRLTVSHVRKASICSLNTSTRSIATRKDGRSWPACMQVCKCELLAAHAGTSDPEIDFSIFTGTRNPYQRWHISFCWCHRILITCKGMPRLRTRSATFTWPTRSSFV